MRCFLVGVFALGLIGCDFLLDELDDLRDNCEEVFDDLQRRCPREVHGGECSSILGPGDEDDPCEGPVRSLLACLSRSKDRWCADLPACTTELQILEQCRLRGGT